MKLRRILALALAALMLLAALPQLRVGARAEEGRSYAIEVDIANQIVTVYDADTRAIVRQMPCSTGMNDYTPTGEFSMAKTRAGSDRLPWYKIEGLYVRYAARIAGEILFHSIPYMRKSLQAINPTEAEKLGTPASHGCIRMRWQDARFISCNCLPGTRVKIFKGAEPNEELRQLLLEASYISDKGITYESFTGMAAEPGALGRSDTGEEVLRLQRRLRELGLYDGEPSGVYDGNTVSAVRLAQYLMDEDMSGSATEAFRQRVYADDAPTAENITLSSGMTGPAVSKLNQNLAALRLYEGEPGDAYDAATVEGVRRFQQAYGYEADAVASPKLQKAADYEASQLAERFGGADYACQWSGDRLIVGRVAAEAGMKLRQSGTRSSKVVRELLYGDGLIVLEPGKEWSRVRIDGDVGYVKNSLISFSEREIGSLRYAAEGSGESYVIGGSAADYGAGAELPCDAFEAYLAENDHTPELDELVGYVTVNTAGEAAALNLRAEADAASEVLDTVENGKRLRVRRRFDEWTQVSYRGKTGYLLNRYLDFWTGPKDARDIEPEGGEGPLMAAVVGAAVGGSASVYAAAFDDAKILASFSNGTALEVLSEGEGWCRIRYQGNEGYMLSEDLKL